MSIPPFYWTLLGEIALVIIGVLSTVIIVVIKDRKKLREYSNYLKDVIKNLKKKLANLENDNDQERVLDLLNALVEHVREQYQLKYGNNIAPEEDDKANDDLPSVEKFVFIAGFQTMLAELSALENSNDPEVTWAKIQNELTPLFHNYLGPILPDASSASSNTEEDASLTAQLENANKRIENLETFKQLYFDLQGKLSKSVAQIEALNEQIATLAEGGDNSDGIREIIEKNKTLYLEMGQMIGMDKEQHHASVANSMDYSDAIMNERKDEIKRLKSQISQQFEDIWKLQNRVSGDGGKQPDAAELSAGIETISRNLKDAEMCIETMDMEIQTLTSEISNLRNQLKDQNGSAESATPDQVKLLEEREAMIARNTQEMKELMSCMTGLEDDNQGQSERIKELEIEYSELEAKYLEAIK